MGLSDNWWTVIIVAITILFALVVRSTSAVACGQVGYHATMQAAGRDAADYSSTEGMRYKQMKSNSL